MTENKGTIQKAAENKTIEPVNENLTLKAYMKRMEGEIKRALPAVLTPERFTRIVLTALSKDPRLQLCTPESFLGAMMQAAQLGLEPNTPLGHAYLVPYQRFNKETKKKTWECQFQLGYKGIVDLVRRRNEVGQIDAQTVYSNDEFSYSLGLNPTLIHKPALRDRGEPVFFYGVYKLKDGVGFGFCVMSMDDVQKHAQKYSQSVKQGVFSPWDSNFEAMAQKTVLKRALKYAPMSVEFQRALSMDETIKSTISEDMFDVPDTLMIELQGNDAMVIPADPETGEITPATGTVE